MNYSLYDIFLKNTIELSRTMIIKLDYVASAMNRKLTDYGQPVPFDKKEWRYYQHLSGVYNRFDDMMTITSLDTSENIVFNKENLKSHKKTRSVYLYRREYVDRLKARYPEQTMLIDGILKPVDIDKAIAASDGTILYYDHNKVEVQEHGLISGIEEWVRSFNYKYIMESLLEVDDLTAITMAGMLYAFLPNAILDLRTKVIRTDQTHSFHILAYLASNQRLDEFGPYLNLKQLMFLYKNILYIERNIGQQQTFDLLVDKLLTARNLPIYEYTLLQRDMDVADGNLYPEPVFSRQQLNLRNELSSRDLDIWEVDDVLHKERYLTPDNNAHIDRVNLETTNLMERSSISSIPTKLLEVSAIDPENIAPVKLIDVLVNEWLHQASTGGYSAVLEVLNPLNGDTLTLSTKQAFLFYIYAYMRGYLGIEMKGITPMRAVGVLRKEWIPDETYLKMLGSDPFNNWDVELEFFAKTAMDVDTQLTSANDFLLESIEIEKRKSVRHQFTFQPHRYHDRNARRTMYNYNYIDVLVDLREQGNATYQELFHTFAFEYEYMTTEGWQDLSLEILDVATQYNSVARISITEIQSAMVRLFRRLSSYTVQFAEEVIGTERVSTEPMTAIPGNTLTDASGQVHTHTNATTIIGTECETMSKVDVPIKHATINDIDIDMLRQVNVNNNVGGKCQEDHIVHVKVNRLVSSINSWKKL